MTGRGREALRWGGVGAAVLAAHVAGGVWAIEALRRPAVLTLPEPVFAELLPEPTAPVAADAGPAAQDAPEAAAFAPPPLPELPPVADFAKLLQGPAPVPDFAVPPLTELPPLTDFAELLPDSALRLAASDRPPSRPARREAAPEPQVARRESSRDAAREPPRQEPRRDRAEPAAQAETPRQTGRAAPTDGRARQSGGAQGAARASTGADKQQMTSWTSRVGGRVAAHMKRTRVPGGGRGTVTIQVSVSISASGAASARLVSSTGNAQVDAALARQAGRMPKMPAPPNGQGASFVLPIQIKL